MRLAVEAGSRLDQSEYAWPWRAGKSGRQRLMKTFADFFPDLLVVVALLLAALALAPVTRAIGLPAPAAFLAVGIAAGYAGVGPTAGLEELPLEQIGAVALYAVLFQGGLATGFRAWRKEAGPILLLGTVGTAVPLRCWQPSPTTRLVSAGRSLL